MTILHISVLPVLFITKKLLRKYLNSGYLLLLSESPWSNRLTEQQITILGYTVAKTMEDCKTDLSIALSWAVSAKDSLKNVNGFSPNQLVFSSNPNLHYNMEF